MKTTQENLLNRINQILEKAKKVAVTRHNISTDNFVAPDTLDRTIFFEWKNNAQNFIVLVCGENSSYYKDFVDKVKHEYPSDLEAGIGILNALKEDLELGYLTNIKNLVIAEVFSDFIDIAEHLLENGYKDPAASLVGAVLENGLRKIAEKYNIPIRNNDDIGSLNTKIADKEIYNRLVQRQIQAWKAIRDSADHGRFNDYKSDDVKSMLEGVRRFLTENI